MAGIISTEQLARLSARRPWTTVGVWAVVVVAAMALSSALLADAITTQWDFTNTPESKRGARLLEERLRGPEHLVETVIVQSDTALVADPAFERRLGELTAAIDALGPGVIAHDAGTPLVMSPYAAPDPATAAALTSADGRSAAIVVTMAGGAGRAADNLPALREIIDSQDGVGGFDLAMTGPASVNQDSVDVERKDLLRGEMIGVPIALLILLAVFGALVAALVPLALAVVSIMVAFGIAALVGQALTLSVFLQNMVVGMGLAVGIDYSLFILQRYREERAAGRDRAEAIGRAGATASRAVFFSGMTVVLALAGLFFVPADFFWSMAIGAILVVLVSVLASLTLLPAVLSLLGDRVDALSPARLFRLRGGISTDPEASRLWGTVARTVSRAPVAGLMVSAGILLAALLPAFGLETGLAGVSTLPERAPSRQGFDIAQREFGGLLNSPIEVVLDGPVASEAAQAGMMKLLGLAAADPDLAPMGRPTVNAAGDLALISLAPTVDAWSEAAIQAVNRLRDDYIPEALRDAGVDAYVSGLSARSTDFTETVDRLQPWVFAFVLALSFVLLTLVFRSLVVPAKAILMNLLSVGAAYGLLVLVFQEGVGAGLLGLDRVEAIESWLPLFLFAVLFGLSMDYEVFILSRMRERYDLAGHDNREAVRFGLVSTGRLITGAAAIMVAVFVGMASGDSVPLQQLGFGLAVAILVDATIVRSVLLPSAMILLGDANWYFPRWLRWLPDVRVEGRRRAQAGG